MKRPAIFYGWLMLGAGVVLMIFNSGTLIYGFTTFIDPVAMTFGWSYAQISLASSLRGAETGVLNPFLGMAVDRWPARRLILIGVILFGLGFFLLSKVNSLGMFYGGFLIVALGSSLAVNVVLPTLVARWFKRKVGRASGILALGNGIGGLMIPVLVRMIDAYTWQNTLVILAFIIWGIGIPLSFFFRNSPQEYGLNPDGNASADEPDSVSTDIGVITAGGRGVRYIMKTRAFWYIGLATMLQMAVMNGVTVHIVPYFGSIGIDRETAGNYAMLIPLVSLAIRVPFGMSADYIKTKYVVAFDIALLGIGSLILWLVDGSSLVLIVLFAVIFGFGMGGFMPLRTPLLREYFGVKNFGAIFGLTSVFITIGSIASPPLLGLVYDLQGTYGNTYLVLCVLALVGAAVMLLLPSPPGRKRPIVKRSRF